MTDSKKWIELAERCERATGPDREIDATLRAYIENWSSNDLAYCLRDINHTADVPRYTASLDAITHLIERELPGLSFASGFASKEDADDGIQEGCFAAIFDEGLDVARVQACATEPLARCAAFCRAMYSKSGEKS